MARTATTRTWWGEAVVYQVYVRSFADANGDGIGDLAGARSRLEYLSELGVDAIWLTPCYPSPQHDHGYDVADYFAIEPEYGGLEEFDALVTDARRHGIRVLMDIVPNHCSHEHSWFREALAAPPGSPARERFYFRDGTGPDGSEPPNNWRAVFGGSTWTRTNAANGTPGQWYLHTFTPWQPDFNWSNPDVIEHFDEVLRFWFDRGVDGFRVDAVTVVGKAPGLPDAPEPTDGQRRDTDAWIANPYNHFWPSAHEHWKHWRTVIDEYEAAHPGRQLFTVAEAYTPKRPDLLLQYVRGEFHQSFSFDLMLAPWRADWMREAIREPYDVLSQHDVPVTWTLNNHDTQRAVTRYGRADATEEVSYTANNLVYTGAAVDEELGAIRARAAAVLLYGLPGSIYLYQGEELGLPEVLDLPDVARQDPIFARTDGREPGRDGCRVPLPWTADAAAAHGFSPANPVASPWLPQPESWGRYGADAAERDPSSMLSLYRAAAAWRRRLPDLGGSPDRSPAPLEWVLEDHPTVVAFARGDVIVAINTGADAVALPAQLVQGRQVVLSSAMPTVGDVVTPDVLPGDTAVWLAPPQVAAVEG
jgi:alpha-glucosidase